MLSDVLHENPCSTCRGARVNAHGVPCAACGGSGVTRREPERVTRHADGGAVAAPAPVRHDDVQRRVTRNG